MAHTRIRKFNTKDTYPEQSLDNDLCQTVVAKGSMVFVRGQVGQDLDDSKSVSIGDPTGQAEQAMANIETLLEEAGAKLEHICKITIYIIDPRATASRSIARSAGGSRACFRCRRDWWYQRSRARNGWWKSTPSP
jgi:enamine deaminase RidA (YjgF/YER057c/UK114 family)